MTCALNTCCASGIQVEGTELKPGDSTVLKDNARVVIGNVSFLARSLGKGESILPGELCAAPAFKFCLELC